MSLPKVLLLAVIVVFAAGCASKQPQAKSAVSINWSTDYEAALVEAEQNAKPVMMDVGAVWCYPCKLLEEGAFSHPEVVAASRDFVCVKVDADKNGEVVIKHRVEAFPTVVFLDPAGNEIGRTRGVVPHKDLLEEMKAALEEVGALTPESEADA